LILNEIQKNVAVLKHTWNVGIEGLRGKEEDVLGYSARHILMKIEKGRRQRASETDKLKAGFSKGNN
jgi:hypothetical protein